MIWWPTWTQNVWPHPSAQSGNSIVYTDTAVLLDKHWKTLTGWSCLRPQLERCKSCTLVKLFKKITQRATCVEPKVEDKEWSGCASMWLLSRVAMHDIKHGKNQREQFQISTMHTSVLTQMAEETIRRGIHTSLFGFWEKTRWKHQSTCYNLAKLSPHPYLWKEFQDHRLCDQRALRIKVTLAKCRKHQPKFQCPLSQPTSKLASVYHPAAHLLRNLRPTGRVRRDESISHPMVQSLSLSHWYFHLFRPFQGTGFVISSPLGMLSTRGTTAWNVTASFQWTFRLSCRKATVVFDALLCMSFAMESRPIMTVRTWSTWSLVAQLSCSIHPHAIGSWTANWAPSGSWAWK